MNNYIDVVIDYDTIGKFDVTSIRPECTAYDFIGEIVEVMLHDENGDPLRVSGILTEIL